MARAVARALPSPSAPWIARFRPRRGASGAATMASISALVFLDAKGKPVLSRDYRCVLRVRRRWTMDARPGRPVRRDRRPRAPTPLRSKGARRLRPPRSGARGGVSGGVAWEGAAPRGSARRVPRRGGGEGAPAPARRRSFFFARRRRPPFFLVRAAPGGRAEAAKGGAGVAGGQRPPGATCVGREDGLPGTPGTPRRHPPPSFPSPFPFAAATSPSRWPRSSSSS